MPLSNNPSAYRDVKHILDQAVEAGGARYVLPNYREAIRWRLRAHHFRQLLLKLSERTLPAGMLPNTPYDGLVLRMPKKEQIEDTKKPVAVTIEWQNVVPGQLTALDGSPLTSPEKVVHDELALAAQRLLEDHDGTV